MSIQGHPGSRGRKSQIQNFGSGLLEHIFRSNFEKNAKNDLKHFLKGLNRTKFRNRKIAEILVNSVKKRPYWSFTTAKLSHFPRYDHENLYTYSSTSFFFTYFPVFLIIKHGKFWKAKKIVNYFLNFIIFKTYNQR